MLHTVEINKRLNFIKSLYKVIEKLIVLHSKGKLTLAEFKAKLPNLRDRMILYFEEIKKLNEAIKEEKRESEQKNLKYFIAEFLYFNNYVAAGNLYIKKHNINIDRDFYHLANKFYEEVNNKKFSPFFEFLKDKKIVAKGVFVLYKNQKINLADLERILKIHNYINMCKNKQKKEAVIYIQKEFQNNPEAIKKYLNLLINDKKNILDCLGVNTSEELAHLVKNFYLALYKQCDSSRLEKRIEYGIICYKTKMCDVKRNPDCPTCLSIVKNVKDDLPYSRKDNSVILCKGSAKEMNESNQAYCFESGFIYCEDYIVKMNYNYICKETGIICKENPQKCFFV